jgi:hypothetical protein
LWFLFGFWYSGDVSSECISFYESESIKSSKYKHTQMIGIISYLTP